MISFVFEHEYNELVCFLCSDRLNDLNRSEEHVFPKWLQNRFHLWNRRLTLLNQTEIRYRDLKVPCCTKCNNEKLSHIEREVGKAVMLGYDHIKAIGELDLFLWACKIFLGIIYKELFLQIDRQDRQKGMIMDQDFIKRYSILHFWLQAYNSRKVSNFCPGSIFIFKTQSSPNIGEQYDFVDDIEEGVLMIKMNDILIIVDCLENGVHKELLEAKYSKFYDFALHPQQAKELFAIVLYNAKRLAIETTVNLVKTEDGVHHIVNWSSPIDGYFHEWDYEVFLDIHSYISGIPREMLQKTSNTVATFLTDSSGTPLFWKLGEPYPLSKE